MESWFRIPKLPHRDGLEGGGVSSLSFSAKGYLHCVLLSGLWRQRGSGCCVQDQRSSGCLVCSTPRPCPVRSLVQQEFDCLHAICHQQTRSPSSHDQCLLYHSSHPCFTTAWGTQSGAFVGHPGYRAKRGRRETPSLNSAHRSRGFGESFYLPP